MRSQLGTVLGGRYLLERQLGMGGMGTVFAASDRSLQRSVAIKLLNADAARDPSQVSRFEQEARAIAALGHPHITALYDFHAAADPTPFLVMELVEGESLRGLLNRERQLAPQRAVALTLQMLSALGAAHALGTIHRDIKPSNVMLATGNGSERVKIVDFGVAKMAEGTARNHHTAEGNVIGTLQYMPPEQARGLPVTPASDLYSVGVCLFEMLAGYNPFAVGELGAVLVAVRELIPPDLRRIRGDVPEFVASAVARTLAKDPAARFSSAGELAAALSGGGPATVSGLATFAGPGPATFAGSAPATFAGSAPVTFAGPGSKTVAGPATRRDGARGPATFGGGVAPAPVAPRSTKSTFLIAGLALALGAVGAVAATLFFLRPPPAEAPPTVIAPAVSSAVLATAAATASASNAPLSPLRSTTSERADKPGSSRPPAPSLADAGPPSAASQQCICNASSPAGRKDGFLCRELSVPPLCSCHPASSPGTSLCNNPFTTVGNVIKCADGSAVPHRVMGATHGGRCTGYSDTTESSKVVGVYECDLCGTGFFSGRNGDACEGYHRRSGSKFQGRLSSCD